MISALACKMGSTYTYNTCMSEDGVVGDDCDTRYMVDSHCTLPGMTLVLFELFPTRGGISSVSFSSLELQGECKDLKIDFFFSSLLKFA